jgi:hypothetical protein
VVQKFSDHNSDEEGHENQSIGEAAINKKYHASLVPNIGHSGVDSMANNKPLIPKLDYVPYAEVELV